MSIKRTKQRSSGPSRRDDSAASSPSKAPVQHKTWSEQVEGKPDEAFVPYSLDSHYAVGALIQHAKFGRGAVLEVIGPHIVVVFADGTKKLSHVSG